LVFASSGGSSVSRAAIGTPPGGDEGIGEGIGEEPVGLTAASLKHLRRQRDKLVEDKGRLEKELSALQAQLKEQKERVVIAEAEVKEAKLREASLREEVAQAKAAEEAQRERAIEAERQNKRLEESLAQQVAEVIRLKEALESQRTLTKEVCEAAERRTAPVVDTTEFKDRIRALESERDRLQRDLQRRNQEYEDMRISVAGAMFAAEKAMAMHAVHAQHIEHLRASKIAEAINEKVELHISVPRVTLNYNSAPPLLISAATGLNDANIREFLHAEVFPKFEPLWVRMDKLDIAPDGTTKRAYSSKMLDKLTEAVKCFVKKSQQVDELSNQPRSPGQNQTLSMTPRKRGTLP